MRHRLAQRCCRRSSPGCDNGICEPSATLDSYDSWRTVYVVSLIGGAALGAAGVTLLLLKPGAEEHAGELRLGLGAGSASLSGSF